MNDKCRWKYGKFYPCDRFNPIAHFNCDAPGLGMDRHIAVCDSCKKVIRKPKPAEPIIRKSGGTFVAMHYGVDYLCLQPNRNSGIAEDIKIKVLPNQLKDPHWWKPIDEIGARGITDELAHLHPMLIGGWRLESVFEGQAVLAKMQGPMHTVCLYSPDSVLLARVSDLEAENE